MRHLLFSLLLLAATQTSGAIYMTPGDFVSESFATKPSLETLWLTPEFQETAKRILGHPYRGLRVRYWRDQDKSLWVLDEIGKEKPITVGVVIEDDRVSRVAILAFRESRGGEVRHPFFTRQFDNVYLEDDLTLSEHIDGITGATMSVDAVTNVTRFALYLHRAVVDASVAPRSEEVDG